MLKVTVIEKGGTEKEWFFASDEVFIGRVQNNGIVLPKPNVSKRHAVIRLADGHIVFEDLKSTNGSYVNGRRISSPRELVVEDRVYIGDYVLQVTQVEPDAGQSVEAQPEPEQAEARGATIAMPAFDIASPPMAADVASDLMEMPPLPGDSVLDQLPDMPQEPSAATEFEVEVEIEEPVAPIQPEAAKVEPVPPVVVPPKVADAPKPAPAPVPRPAPVPTPAPTPVAVPTPVAAPRPAAAPVAVPAAVPPPSLAPAPAAAPAPVPAPAVQAEPLPVSVDPVAAVSGLAKRLGYSGGKDGHAALRALSELAGRDVFASIPAEKADFSDAEWQKLSDGVMRLVDRLRRDNQIPADVDPIDITQKVLFEYAGLGPLEELLSNQAFKAIIVSGLEGIQVIEEAGSRTIDEVFSNFNTFNRVAVKLCSLAGIGAQALSQPLVEGRLPDGSTLQILGAPFIDQGRIIVIERPMAAAMTVSQLKESAGLSEKTVQALKAAVEARGNIIVCGPPYTSRCVITNSLAMMVGSECRVLALGGRRDIDINLPNLVSIRRNSLVQASNGAAQIISRVLPDYIVMNGVESADAGLLQELGLGGFDGLLVSIVSSSAEDCLNRLKLMIQFASPGVDAACVDALVDRLARFIVVLGFNAEGRTVVTGVYENVDAGNVKAGSPLIRIDLPDGGPAGASIPDPDGPTEVSGVPVEG